MREKLKSGLQSLKNKLSQAWRSFSAGFAKGWKSFSAWASRKWKSFSAWASRNWKSFSAWGSKGWKAFCKTRFAIAIRNGAAKLWDSRPIRAIRTKAGALKGMLPKKAPPVQSSEPKAVRTEKKSAAQMVEDGDLTTEAIESELRREKYKHRYSGLLRSTVYTLIVIAAAAALVATLLLPVLQIYGNSMSPTLREGDVVVTIKTNSYDYGDICSFYYSNRILVKRVIGKPMDRIDIDDDGNVYVNGKLLDEPYVKEKAKGVCDIDFPFRVPEGSYFMIGDHRETSIDSRSSTIGCISQDEIVGKILFTVWPIKHFGVTKYYI